MSNIYLVFYIVIWLITFSTYLKKRRNLDIGGISILSFFMYSVASLIHYNQSYRLIYDELKLFPFIYLYLMLMLAMSPILKYNDQKIDVLQKPSRGILLTVIVFYIVNSFIRLSGSLPDVYDGIKTIIIDSAGGVEIYREVMDISREKNDFGNITNVFAIFSNLLADIGIFLFFFYLTLKKKNKYILLGLFISIIGSILSPIAMSQRGPAVQQLLTIIAAFFIFKKFLPLKIIQKIKITGVVLIILISVPFIAITISRFGDRDGGAKGSVFAYTGMQNLNFNIYGFDNGGLRYGDRTFPLFKKMLGYENVPNDFWQRRVKYPNLKINDEVFIGFVGDFTLDFGPFIASLFFILFTINALYRTKIRNRVVLFHQLFLLYFVACVCIQGGMKLFSFADIGGNLRLIMFALIYFAFKIDYKMKINKVY